MASKIESTKFKRFVSIVWKRGIRQAVLAVGLFLYTICGASLFITIEGKNEMKIMDKVWTVRDNFLHYMWLQAQTEKMNFDRWRQIFIEKFDEDISDLCTDQAWVIDDKYERHWTFGNAVHYCSSVYFAIGYGDMFPITTTGRIVTMIYAVFGIPYVLCVIRYYSLIFIAVMDNIYSTSYHFYYTGKIKKLRLFEVPPVRRANKAIWIFHTMTISYGTRPATTSIGAGERRYAALVQRREEKEFEMPLLFSFILVISFIFGMGYIIYTYLENWSALESYYYLFIVLTTIGFGDYVLTSPGNMLAVHSMLLIGFVMMSMLLDLLQAKVAVAKVNKRSK